MKTYKITCKDDLKELIDRYGQKMAWVEAEKADCDEINAAIRDWIAEHPDDAKGKTKQFEWRLKLTKRGVGIERGHTLANVLESLAHEPTMSRYIAKDLDRDALRSDFGNAAKRAELLENFGIKIDEPKKTLVVEGLK